MVKLLRAKDKGKVLKAARKIMTCHVQGNFNKFYI